VSTETTPDEETGELNSDILKIVKAQHSGGSVKATIPADAARDLGIEKGDRVAFTGKEGDEELTLQKAEDIL
jgi:antitoxin component of MazEF toxin-antitoxin module